MYEELKKKAQLSRIEDKNLRQILNNNWGQDTNYTELKTV